MAYTRPYTAEKSNSVFHIPSTLADDFRRFLNTEFPGSIFDYEVLHDWYDQFKQDYKQNIWRGEIYPDSTKSRYANTDNNLNVRFEVLADIQKGDYIIQHPTNTIYLLDWDIAPQSNNRASRALRCNVRLNFQRWFAEKTDARGIIVQPAGYRVIIEDIPCNAYRYDGRPQFSAVGGTPGIAPNALTILSVQMNPLTATIEQGDVFEWGRDTYIIVDIDRVGLTVGQDTGVLKIQARKKAGGAVGVETIY